MQRCLCCVYILQPPPATSPHLRILNGHLAITSPAQPAPRPQTTLTEIYKLKRHNFSFNLLFSVEHGPHVTRTLLWTNLASKYFGKYSKVKHTFKLHTNPTYKNEEVKIDRVLNTRQSKSSQVSPCTQCMRCLSIVIQIFLCLRS